MYKTFFATALLGLLVPAQAFAQATCSGEFATSDGSTFVVCDWDSGNPTWAQASDFCFDVYGGSLATISNAEQNDTINANSFTDRVWIGFNDIDVEGTFVWENGESVTFTNWSAGEPNNSGGEDCAEMRPSGLWNDIPCTFGGVQELACEIEPSSIFVESAINGTTGYANTVDEGSDLARLRPSVIDPRIAGLKQDYPGCSFEETAGTFGSHRTPRVQGSTEGGDLVVGDSLASIDVGATNFVSNINGARFDGTGDDGRMVSGYFVRISGNARVAWYGVIADCTP